MSATRPRFKFDPEWRTTLFVVVMVPLMTGLGFWQLQRADEKTALATAFEARQQRGPVALATLVDSPAEELAYTPARLRGSFDPEAGFLLDNRISEGRFGYEVLGIFYLADGGTALVNRGWIAGDASRQVLPEVPAVPGEVEITGHVYVSPGKPYLLEEQTLGQGWPKRIQAVDMALLGQAVSGPAPFPYPVRIDAGQAGALGVNWQVVNMSPRKHQGYAVQWFTMAAVLALIYLLHSSNLWQVLKGSETGQ